MSNPYEEEALAAGGHTQFLDLTNGTGGEQPPSVATLNHNNEDQVETEDEHEEESPKRVQIQADSPPPSASTITTPFDPSTPGRVVETGHEHTGRWTKEEHDAFLSALLLYGKEWKKVAAKVKTRTVVQTRTHAQKYFQKLQKSDGSPVEMGTATKKPRKKKLSRRTSTTTMSAAQVMTSLSSSSHFGGGDPKRQPASSSCFETSAAAYAESKPFVATASSASLSQQQQPRHGFGMDNHVMMKIGIPNTTTGNMFPEPSPAATGKRKLAEIAAARMLAGVMEDSDNSNNNDSQRKLPPPPPLQIVNPESLGVSVLSSLQKTGQSPTTPWDGDMMKLETQLQDAVEDSIGMDDDRAKLTSIVTGAPSMHPVLGPPHSYNRSPLHAAVCQQDIPAIQASMASAGGSLDELDEAGYGCLHTACAMGNHDVLSLLLSAGADPVRRDSHNNTPLHWAARFGDVEATLTLLKITREIQSNDNGETPLHWAMRACHMPVVGVLLDHGARPSNSSKQFRRPIDVAAAGFADQEGSLAWHEHHKKDTKKVWRLTLRERREARAGLLARSVQSRSLVLFHPECLEHVAKTEADWEAPDRITTILNLINGSGAVQPHEVTCSQEFDRASLDLLSRVHSSEYLKFVNNLSKDLEKKMKLSETGSISTSEHSTTPPPVVPFTPMVQRQMINLHGSAIKEGINSDTAFSAGSLRAARRAVGAVQHAVDCVLVGRNRNSFCVVRPPGHHAGISGLLEGGESCGFCIFNNVAAGALHAISDDKSLCKRCAIVDIDVHHGNGTEEIVRKCQDPSKLFFFSIHLYDNDKKKKGSQVYKFYPGTGDEDDLALNIINVPIVPLWKEPLSAVDTVRTHNTRKKARAAYDGDESDSGYARSDSGSGSGSVPPSPGNPRVPTLPCGRLAYRQAIQDRLLPSLRAFNPDLILISAGFDAAKGDVGNARHERGRERVGLDLEPEDYAWTTRKILEIADICCQGKVVSVLEGGYGRSPAEGVQGLDRSLFGECAVRHLHAMIDPYDSEKRFSS